MLLQQIFSNLTLKDKKLSYSLKKPVEVLAKRVQEKLDSQKNLEPSKTLAQEGHNGETDPQTSTLLRGQDSNLEPTP